MINTLRHAAARGLLLASVIFAFAAPVFSQAPTDAQRSAIRSQCRSDYQAHCASIPPGGAASLQCLQQNISSLSPSCQTAVRAVEAPAAPKAEAAPAAPKAESAPAAPKAGAAPSTEATKPSTETAAPKPAAETAPPPAPKAATSAAKKPSSAQIAAIRSACRSDYQRDCAGVPTGGAAALNCLNSNKPKLSPMCQRAVSAAGGGATPPAAGGTTATAEPAAAAAPAPALVLRPMRPREVLFVLRSACGGDARALCAGVPPGGGRIIQCLASQPAALSPACSDVLGQFAAQ
jgi:outer membrane biosynthesis protein TonB